MVRGSAASWIQKSPTIKFKKLAWMNGGTTFSEIPMIVTSWFL